MGEVAAVDVARSDLSRRDLVLAHRQRSAVVRDAGDARERSGQMTLELDDLPTAAAQVVGVARCLAVHAEKARGLFDHPVRLARHDVGIIGEADIERLTAASQCELQGVGRLHGARADGHRAFETCDRAAERFDGARLGAQVLRQQRRDDLGIGGDLGGDQEVLGGDEVGEVVDIAVEHADRIRTIGATDLFAVQGMRVRFGHDAHARPAGMAEHQGVRVLTGEGLAQQLVLADGRA
ncbi:unannotated protein [freshwater metagenome]|uniref:Unannotated protein n=1 Tax=freshwater metagenome TaxID=449393 RepID=A0A6J7AQQ1_9ZZZZ